MGSNTYDKCIEFMCLGIISVCLSGHDHVVIANVSHKHNTKRAHLSLAVGDEALPLEDGILSMDNYI